nr:hypothetical protein [uncultured Halomonas sp.]
MVERSDEPRLTTPIVPESDSELVARHRSPPVYRRRTRTWPLWVICLLLLVGLLVLSASYWIDRQTLMVDQRHLEGQLSNLHARLDSLGDSREVSNTIEQRLTDMQAAREALQAELGELKVSLDSLEQNSADDAALGELAQRFETANQRRDTLTATISAMQRSLDILEQSGEDARASLVARLDDMQSALDEMQERRRMLAEDDTELQSRLAGIEETQAQLQASLESRLDEMAGTLETLQNADATQQQRLEELSASVSASQTSLTELRQNQLVLNAIIESLDSQ